MGTNPESFNPFSGTHALFIQYNDIIKSPMLEVMQMNRRNPKLNSLLDLSPIKYLYPYGMYEWYTNRQNWNPLREFDPENTIDEQTLVNIMGTFIHSDSRYTSETRTLPFVETLKFIVAQKYNMKIFIYDEFENPYIKTDLDNLFPNMEYTLVTSDIVEVLRFVPKDATYVFSNIMLIDLLKYCDKLQLSNILVAGNYRYNYQPDNPDVMKIYLAGLRNEYAFKLRMFTASELLDKEKQNLSRILNLAF